MTDQPTSSVPTAPPPVAPAAVQPEPPSDRPNLLVRVWRRDWKTWQVIAIAVAAMLVVASATGADVDAVPEDAADVAAATEASLRDAEERADAGEAEIADLQGEVERLEGQLADRADDGDDADVVDDAREEELEALLAQLDERDEQIEALSEELETLTAASEEDDAPADGPESPSSDALTAGNYSFADVQVSRDFADDFQVRARVTNNGGDRTGVGFTATLFSGGSVVGTASGLVNEFGGGSTVTVEFISLDSYTDWDDVQFQIEYEF